MSNLQRITLVLDTEADPSDLLDAAHEFGARLVLDHGGTFQPEELDQCMVADVPEHEGRKFYIVSVTGPEGLPTFHLDADILGITSPEHAERIARRIIRDPKAFVTVGLDPDSRGPATLPGYEPAAV